MIGGTTSVAANNLVRCRGREPRETVVFLLRGLLLRESSEIVATFTEALVLLFDGVVFFCCFFLLRKVMRVSSSESSVGI